MKEIVPTPPAVVRPDVAGVRELFQRAVVPTYARFDLSFTRGQGSSLWDISGRRYLDFGSGIAVSALGHAHPEIAQVMAEQAGRLWHISNLYYHEPQGRLAQALVERIAPGKCFFCNSGAEANEALFKLARKFGHEEGRYEIITTVNSFHGRTLAGIAATGQDKIKKGFEPMVPGFRHVPYHDLGAVESALTPATAAVLIEGIQGESGVRSVSAEYLLGLRDLCNRRKLLLFMDEVQCGHYRTGRFQSYQRVLESQAGADGFLPDAVSMAKSLGGGFPLGAVWIRAPYADLLGPGSHGTTFGGGPLGCTLALKILEIIQRDGLDQNARELGAFLKTELQRIAASAPAVIKEVRGLGFMIGIELQSEISAFEKTDKSAAGQFVNRLHDAGLLTVPAGTHVVRILPALNLTRAEAEEGLQTIERVVRQLL